MVLISIAVFFVITLGLGFTLTRLVKESDNFLERNLMRLGFGLSLAPFLAIVLNIVKIPADWRIISFISILFPTYFIFKNFSRFDISKFTKIKLTKTNLSIFVMLLIFIATFYVYLSGTFKYPYLEDEDPWGHSEGVKYVYSEKNVFSDSARFVRYIHPYPPTYDLLLGILHQTNDSVYWTLKFFNALIISLSVIFFYFFVKEFSGNGNKALFATFALASIPAFLSHFIWAIALSVPLYFVSFYAVERIKYDRKWWIVSGLVMVTTMTSSPTHSTYFGLLFVLYLATKIIIEEKILIYHALAGFSAVFLSILFWWLPMIMSYGTTGLLTGLGLRRPDLIANVGGTGDRIYSLSDFIFAQKQNMINNPVGIGFVLSLLLIVSLISLILKYRYYLIKNKWIVLVSYPFLMVILLFFLSSTYTKVLWGIKEDIGSIPFNVFISDQIFLIISMAFIIFALLTVVIARYKNKDFKDTYLVITLVWLLFAFYAVNAGPYNFKLSPFRAWMLLVIPVSILASQGAFYLMNLLKKFGVSKIIVLVLLIIGIYFTSTQQKIAVNTAIWPAGAFWTYLQDESGRVYSPDLQGYLWMRDNIEPNTKVFGFVVNGPITGMDKFICYWCKDIREFKNTGINKTASEINSFLKTRGYEYIIIDGQFVKRYGINQTNAKMQELIQSGLFTPVFQNQGAVIFRI